jgi:RNA polymerase sigma factor (sigma-70 family)
VTVDEREWLAERFEANRAHLRAVAYRMLGSLTEADDAVQEAWLRSTRADPGRIENVGGWLTTLVARASLDMLRTRRSRREESLEAAGEGPVGHAEDGVDPEREAVLADSVGVALLTVLETLGPAERLAFVLHDLSAVPFDEIAPIFGRSPAAARQLASRARRRVRGATMVGDPDIDRRRAIVDAFLAASRGGDFDALLSMLDPDVVIRADRGAVRIGALKEVRGATAVAETFSGRARFAQPAVVDAVPGAVWAPGGRAVGRSGGRAVGRSGGRAVGRSGGRAVGRSGGRAKIVFEFTIERGRIVRINLLASARRLRNLDLAFEGQRPR